MRQPVIRELVLTRLVQSLLQTPLSERRKRLAEAVVQVPHLLRLAESMESSDTEEIATFLTESVRSGCEGLMVKTLDRDATYEPSRRSLNWLKLKKDYMEGTTDSLDLVVIGGYHGRGKRTGVFGAYLLACYNDEDETLESVCKVGAELPARAARRCAHARACAPDRHRLLGRSAAAAHCLLQGQGHREAAAHVRNGAGAGRVAGRMPGVGGASSGPVAVLGAPRWRGQGACRSGRIVLGRVTWLGARPTTLRQLHPAQVDDVRGIGLRFPRFLRVREDKDVEDATSAEQVVDMYRSQSLVN